MAKKNIAEVQQAREAGMPRVFNMQAAMAALKATPLKTGGARGLGELKSGILEIFKASPGKELSLNQVQAAYKAGFGEDLPAKKFADACWTMSDKNSKNKAPVLKSGANKGCYVLA